MRKINKKLAKLITEKPIKADVSQTENKLYLYGTIGDWWDGVTLDDVKSTVANMNKTKVIVHINSYGGDATEGVAIRNFLMSTFDTIDVVIDGIAASSASIIATCGQTLSMPTGTTYMIHNPWTWVVGNRKDILREAKTLESLEQSYRNIYMERFTGTEEELAQLMDDESWLTANEAQALGFATQKEAESDIVEEPIEDNALVANLLNKYVAKVSSETEPNNAQNDDTDLEASEAKTDEQKPKNNNLLQNLAKVFSNFE